MANNMQNSLSEASPFVLGNFEIYKGKYQNKEKYFSFGRDVVLSLLEQVQLPSNKGHKIIDNYFTGLPVLAHLAGRKYCSIETIRDNCLEQFPVPTKKYWNDPEVVLIF